MDKSVVEKGLRRIALPSERVAALREAGFHAKVIAESIGVSPEALRHWQTGSLPRPEAAARLDRLRAAMGQLLIKGLEPAQAAEWMQSLSTAPPYIRPIDLLHEEPLRVFEMIDNESF